MSEPKRKNLFRGSRQPTGLSQSVVSHTQTRHQKESENAYGGEKMTLELGDIEDAKEWLTSDNWLTFSFGDGNFAMFLEYEYFEPGTPKNSEFETMILPEKGGLSFWFRIKDTGENRKNLREALERFYSHVPEDFEDRLERIQGNVKETVGRGEYRE